MALSDLREATPETSSDDIKALADSVAKEVAEERKAEQRSDAEIVAGNSPAPKPPTAEKKSSSKPAETESQGNSSAEVDNQSEVSGEESAPEWLTDDVKAEAAAYGIDSSELEDFASREELDRALRLFDKNVFETGRKAMAEDESPTRNEKGQFVKKEEVEEADQSEEETPNDGRYQVALSRDLYDDEIIDEFTRMRDHYESRLEALESHFAEINAKTEEQQFDSYVDSLGHADLFGKTGSESKEELERRRDLHAAVKTWMTGLARMGRTAELSDQLVKRVANMAFAEELGKKRLKQQTQKISRQSQLRQGGSPTKPQPPRDDPREEFDRLYRELERA